MKYIQRFIVPLIFLVLCAIGFHYSGMPFMFFANDLLSRLARNSFIVISLIIPVLAGMGLNFGIVLGAMAGQFGAIFTVFAEINGLLGFIAAAAISVPLSMLFGYLTGVLFNKTKGKEMITGLILGFFANGIYLLICLVMVGWIIPVPTQNVVDVLLPSGIGLTNTIDLSQWQYVIDKMFVMKINLSFGTTNISGTLNVPVVSYLLIALLCLAIWSLFKTKLGQDIRAIGQNRHIAEIAGINVDRVRIIAVIFSTILAAWGQLLFLQNLGNLQTYGSHVQVGTFAVAALLIGGASVSRATVGQAIVGILLFHGLFIVSPMAGKNLLGSAQIGEFFRVFVAYGIIGIALALHAWQRKKS